MDIATKIKVMKVRQVVSERHSFYVGRETAPRVDMGTSDRRIEGPKREGWARDSGRGTWAKRMWDDGDMATGDRGRVV